jgi:hypothetical protein
MGDLWWEHELEEFLKVFCVSHFVFGKCGYIFFKEKALNTKY